MIPGVFAQFVEAGHILGSAAIILDYQDESGRPRRLWFSGDIGRYDVPILRDPVLPSDAHTLIMECTYGDKPHRAMEDAYDEFVDAIKRTVNRGGKVIVPAFAVGRTQNLTYLLTEAINQGISRISRLWLTALWQSMLPIFTANTPNVLMTRPGSLSLNTA